MADLPPILAELRAAAVARAERLDGPALTAALADAPPPRALDLRQFGIIAEFKSKAPSAGTLTTSSRDDQVQAYVTGGATAISVLTEPTRFGGSIDDLATVARATDRPVLRKDFVVDPRQVVEARAAGASGVLLMAILLSDDELSALIDTANAHGLFVLAEAHTAEERARVLRAFEARSPAQGLVGINTRDFTTLKTDLDRLDELAPPTLSPHPWVAESGLHTAADVARAARLGFQLGLVGTALMRATDPAAALSAMVAAGRLENPCS